jgi:Peptidase C26
MKELTLGYSPWGTGDKTCYPFNEIFTYTKNCKTEGFDNIDALVLWGGEDIHPSYYGERANAYNGAGFNPSERDKWEWAAMKYCHAKNIPIIGVCRGAQFLCAFAGGKLIQHTTGHTGTPHTVVDITGEEFTVNSYHHQMLDINVPGVKAELLGWSKHLLSGIYYGESRETPKHLVKPLLNNTFKEPEFVYFPMVNGLAIQGHPEWAKDASTKRFAERSVELVLDKLFTKKVWK